MVGCECFGFHVFCFEQEIQAFGRLMVATGWWGSDGLAGLHLS